MKRIISFVIVLTFTTFFIVSDCLADQVDSKINKNVSEELNINKNINEKKENPDAFNEDIFGDEQTFPFVAGLGKNAAH